MSKSYLEPDEVTRLEEAASNSRDRLLVRVLFHLACRVSEALAIATDDIDFTACTITIEQLKTRIKLSCPHCGRRLGRSHAFCPECGTQIQSFVAKEKEHRRMNMPPIDSQTLDVLREYIKRGGPVKRGDKYLIFGINRHRAWQIVKECAERAGLPKLVNPETGKVHNVSPHRLRDSFAVHAMKLDDSGDGLRMLQEHLGHRSFNTTARYRKVAGEERRQWYDNLWSKDES